MEKKMKKVVEYFLIEEYHKVAYILTISGSFDQKIKFHFFKNQRYDRRKEIQDLKSMRKIGLERQHTRQAKTFGPRETLLGQHEKYANGAQYFTVTCQYYLRNNVYVMYRMMA